MKKHDLETFKFVTDHRDLFEQIQKDYRNASKEHDVEYTMLDYKKILGDMCKYLEGYLEYKKGDSEEYAGKLLHTTAKFFDTMFTDANYRMRMTLSDMVDINKAFLEETKRLQDMLEKINDDGGEVRNMVQVYNNQFRRVGKVYRDDMNIYLWLSSSGSKVYNHIIDADLRRKFYDPATPVMHRA